MVDLVCYLLNRHDVKVYPLVLFHHPGRKKNIFKPYFPGYLMLIEVKSSQKAYQKATKQLFDGIDRLKEVLGAIGITSSWLYVGVFISFKANDTPLFDCESCSIFAIVGEESIQANFKIIDQQVSEQHTHEWKPEKHVTEFLDIASEIIFVAQGDPYAPVTGSNLIDKTVQHVERAGSAESTFFWTSEQLSITQALDIRFLVLDAFYSTGKSEVLRYYGKDKLNKGEIVHYFNQRPVGLKENIALLPFTLMLQDNFSPGVVKETTFQFGVDSVQGFLKKYGIEPTHHVIIDELICTKCDKNFVSSLLAMKANVASLWIAMGALPFTGMIND